MRVLVVDDDLGTRLVAEATVRGLGHECVCAEDGDAAWRLVATFAPDVVVTDRSMPGLDGLELCRQIRAVEGDGYTYVILVTSSSNRAEVLEGMNAGADDYVGKPLDPFDLERGLLAARRVTELHAELARTRAELVRQANTDPLTGLRNRLGLAGELDYVHSLSRRYGHSYALALCDVDLFKPYNDTYGHLAGDDALRSIGRALTTGLRDVDRVYRYGGEEFLLLLPETGAPGAERVLRRVLDTLRALAIEHRSGGPSGIVTLSVGIAVYRPAQQVESGMVLARSDEALYAAKAAGRDCIAFADDGTGDGSVAAGANRLSGVRRMA